MKVNLNRFKNAVLNKRHKSYICLVASLALAGLPFQTAQAYFDFADKKITTREIDLGREVSKEITVDIPLQIMVTDTDKNSSKKAPYKIALTRYNPTHLPEAGRVNDGVLPPDGAFSGKGLSSIRSLKVNQVSWDLAKWSPEFNHSGVSGTVTVSLTLDRQELIDKVKNGQPLSFFLAGVSVGSQIWTDKVSVTVSMKYPEVVKISGMKDVTLPSPHETTDKWLTANLDFCVYSSTSPNMYKIKFDGSNDGLGTFMLAQDYRPGIKSVMIDYEVKFKEKKSSASWISVEGGKGWVNNAQLFQGSTKENCADSQGVNAVIQILVARGNTMSASPGTYQDTLKITVEPS